MKPIVISADGDRMAYLVPDEVAAHLEEYCLEFCQWLSDSPHAKKYRKGRILCYQETDFILYLNQWVFPDQPARFLENLGWIAFDEPLPEPYRDCPEFNF